MSTSAGFSSQEITHAGVTMACTVYVPLRHASDARGLPLVLFLHGRGECGSDGVRQMINGVPQRIIREPEKWPAIVVMPQKPDPDKQWIEYEPQVMALLEETMRAHAVDRGRVYVTGLSQGGAGTWAIAAAHPDVFAAIAPVCGYAGDFRKGTDPALVERIGAATAKIPTWAFHGDADDVVAPQRSREIVEAMERAGGAPRFTVYPGVNHNSWDRAYSEPDFTKWLFAQRRGDAR